MLLSTMTHRVYNILMNCQQIYLTLHESRCAQLIVVISVCVYVTLQSGSVLIVKVSTLEFEVSVELICVYAHTGSPIILLVKMYQ